MTKSHMADKRVFSLDYVNEAYKGWLIGGNDSLIFT